MAIYKVVIRARQLDVVVAEVMVESFINRLAAEEYLECIHLDSRADICVTFLRSFYGSAIISAEMRID